MAIVRWSPLLGLNRWPSVWDDEDFGSLMNTASNNLDVYETENEVVIKASVAGIPADKVDITFEKGILWISAKQEEKTQDQTTKYYSSSSWDYSYKVSVPGLIDLNQQPEATVEDGVVTVIFKKSEASKPMKLQVKAKNK